jgi:predicted lipoprotein with Yx(FWY)xxD motif
MRSDHLISKEHTSMKSKYLTSAALTLLVAGIAVVILAVGGGSAKTAPASNAPAGSAVGLRGTSLGNTLVDAKGRTLYLFAGDKANVSTLSSAGLAVWPRFVASGPVRGVGGVKATKLGTITSSGGGRQVTYNGHPLYYYVGDSQPGSARGQALNQFGALWYVLGAGGNAITSAPSTAKAAPGYAY